MKKTFLLLIFLLTSILAFSADSVFSKENPVDAMYPGVALDGKAAALGNSKITISPLSYLNENKIEVRISQKEQLGIIPYNEYSGRLKFNQKFAVGMSYSSSEDLLKADKTSLGMAMKIKKLSLGLNYNIYASEITGDETPSADMKKYFDLQDDLSQENLQGTTAEGNSTDLVVAVDLTDDLILTYYKRNMGSSLIWSVEGEDDLEEEIAEEEIIGFSYNGERINLIGEMENYNRIGLGYERNYYDKLDIRAGISRNINTKDNVTAEKDYTVGIGFNPIARNFIVGIDVAYQMKYFGRDDIFNGQSQDDIAMTTYVKF